LQNALVAIAMKVFVVGVNLLSNLVFTNTAKGFVCILHVMKYMSFKYSAVYTDDMTASSCHL